jgi:WhiB family transcriptional regulator, redox-sensing transcriptional regulator
MEKRCTSTVVAFVADRARCAVQSRRGRSDMDTRPTRRGPILARRVPIPNRYPDIKLPEPPEFTMPPAVLKYAACAGEDPDLFFPDGPPASQNTAHAKAVCARCPVRDECLKWAIDNNQTHGIWGGLDENDRTVISNALAEEV